jgi:DNA invertase Pin-like site-specific DNA recombinase
VSARRVGLYCRVSTTGQTVENQQLALQSFAAARGWEASEYTDQGISGTREKRPARVLLRAKVRPRPPETLRHSFVSGMLSRGAPLLLVARQTGRSPVVLMKHYARWLPQEQPAATPAQPVRRRPNAK